MKTTTGLDTHGILTSRKLCLLLLIMFIALMPSLGGLQIALAANPSGALRIEPITAYNLIVDSNVLSPSTYAPESATLGAKFCNDSTTTSLTNVFAYIGDYGATPTPGVYPSRDSSVAPFTTDHPHLADTGLYSLTHEGGTAGLADATRFIGTIPPGECVTEYWLVSYPRTNPAGTVSVTGGSIKPSDDLWLNYDFWATGSEGATARTAETTIKVTMRNEISAAANKIWPNGDNKVPPEYLDAITASFGWDTVTPGGGGTAWPGQLVTTQGIWYDLGNVGAGFDNNGDLVPDHNAWLQPIGIPSAYDPGCFRLVRTYGIVIVKLVGGGEYLIPFEDDLYFENIPDNTGTVGLVFYEYVALDGACTAGLTPYQEVASGYDNEKFNGDFGYGIPPLQSVEPQLTLTKSDNPDPVVAGNIITYTLLYTNPLEYSDGSGGFVPAVTVGDPTYGTPIVVNESVPSGTCYVAGSADNDAPPAEYTILYSTDNGVTWSTTEPGNTNPANSCADDTNKLQWWRTTALPANTTDSVTFQATVPAAYTPPIVTNTACLSFGNNSCFLPASTTTQVSGSYNLSGTAYRDDGVGGGTLADGANAIAPGEAGIAGINVDLYYDVNANGRYDMGEPLLQSTDTRSYNVYDGYIDMDNDGSTTVPDADDDGTLLGYPIINGGIDLNRDGSITATDDGSFAGYAVFDGRLDMNVSGGTAATTADDGTLLGPYNFLGLPAGNYVVVVTKTDAQVPTYYGLTTADQYGATLSATVPRVTGLDFGFAPPLSVDKVVVDSSIAVGNLAQYTITVSNNLPGSGTGATGNCQYTVWAGSTPADGTPASGSGNSAWLNISNAYGRPNELFSYTELEDNNDDLGLSGYNIGAMGGSIQRVYMTFDIHERAEMDTGGPNGGDRFIVDIYYNNSARTRYAYAGNGSVVATWADAGSTPRPAVVDNDVFGLAYGTGYQVIQELDVQDVAGLTRTTWAWSDFVSNIMELRVLGDKAGGTGDIDLDAIGFIIETDQICSGAATTLNPVPLVDTFDDASDYFDYVSSSPAGTVSGNTIDWGNVGPLYPGQTKVFTVTLRAKTTGSYLNTASSTNPRFADGRAANDDSGTVTVNISAGGANSISGTIFDDNSGPINGWSGSIWSSGGTGIDAGTDTGIPYVPVSLYGCIEIATGNYVTTTQNRTCAAHGGAWQLVASTFASTTAGAEGTYSFANLLDGYYYVQVGTVAGPQVADVNQTTAGNCTAPGCDNRSMDPVTGTTVNGGIWDLVDAGNVTQQRVNFGYNVPSGTFTLGDTIFHDWDGDGIKDDGDEGIDGVTVELLNADGSVRTSTTTVDGTYQFTGLPAGVYTVRIVTSSLPSGSMQTYDPDETSPTLCVTCDNKSTITLTANNDTRDFGYRPYGSGSIGDTIWRDMNADGAQLGTLETGIAGVTVYLLADMDGDGNYAIAKSTTTDASGKYLFTNLPDGAYRVAVAPSDGALPDDAFGSNYVQTTGTQGSVSMETGGPTSYVYFDRTISGGNTILTADFGFAPLAAIGDTIYWDSNGDGEQDTGEPGISGVTVGLYYWNDDGDNIFESGELGTHISDDVTDASGQYLFSGLPTNLSGVKYAVQVGSITGNPALTGDPNADGLACTASPEPWAGFYANCDGQYGLTLYPGSSFMGADFGYQPPGTIGDRLWIDSNSNGVSDAGENGIPYVDIDMYIDVNANGTFDFGTDTFYATAETDADGYYLFENVANNNYVIVVDTLTVAEDGDAADADFPAGLTQAYDPDASLNGQTRVIIGGGAVTQTGTCTVAAGCDSEPDPLYLEADFGYRFAGTYDISGTICLETTSIDGVCDTDTSGVGTGEAAYNSVTVYLYRWTDDGDNIVEAGEVLQVATTTTTAAGDYSFPGIATNGLRYVIAIGAPQSGLDLTTTQPLVGAPTTSLIETSATNGDTLSAYQAILIGGDNVTNRDFAFQPRTAYDYGDLPDTYSTTLQSSPDGPRNAVPGSPTLYLGAAAPDTELNGTPTADASGDGADEDGVTLILNGSNQWVITCDAQGHNCTADIQVVVNVPAGGGWLYGWMDFSNNGAGDGDFTDTYTDNDNGTIDTYSEMVVSQYVTTSGTLLLHIPVPPTIANTTLAGLNYRFRLMPTEPLFPSLAYSGTATSGEVEDYHSGQISTTPITLAYFQATEQMGITRFEWSTDTEVANVGFNLYVQNQDGLQQINTRLIPSKSTDSLQPQGYSYIARSVTGTIFYLEDVSLTTETRQHGPFTLGDSYGERPVEEAINWSVINAENDWKERQRDAADKAAAASQSAENQAELEEIAESENTQLDGTNNQAPGQNNSPLQGASAPLTGANSRPQAVLSDEQLLQPLLDGLDTAWKNGDICKKGVYHSLRTKVEGAQFWLDRDKPNVAASTLNAFINELSAQSGKCVKQSTAETLSALAQALIDQILHPVTPTPTETPVPTETPSPTGIPTDTPAPTETPAPTGTPTETPAPTETPTDTPSTTETATPTETISPTDTPSPTPSPTTTLTPTSTSEPTVTPTPTEIPEEEQIAELSKLVAELEFPTVELRVKKDGLYRLTYEQIKAAGLDLNNVPVENIALLNRGARIPLYIDGGPLFGPDMAVEFYGQGLDTLYTDTNIYWLVVSADFANRVAIDNTAVDANAIYAPYYLETTTLNRQKGYAFHSPFTDPWFDSEMLVYTTPKMWSFDLQVDNLIADAAGTLAVNLYGGTDWPGVQPDHHVVITFNGQPVADELFNATEVRRLSMDLPAGSLLNGTNTLALNLPGDTGVSYELVNFDSAHLTYPRAFAARDDSLTFRAAGDAFRVSSLPSADVVVYQVDATGSVTRLSGVVVSPEGSTYSAAFPGSGKTATYVVTAKASMLTPGMQAAPPQADITSGRADFLIIAHPNFISGIQPLVQARQAQGYTVRVVSVEDVYRQFSYGIFDAQAIRRYTRYAIRNMGVHYVLLVGGDTYDYRNYIYSGAISFIPSLYTETHPLVHFAPSDVLYTDIDNDNVPEAAIGRFPVRTSAELNSLVTKTLAYGNKNYGNTAIFSADTSEPAAQFAADSDAFIGQLGGEWAVTRAYLDEMPVSTAQTTLIDAINRGTALTSFVGHSSYTRWTFQGLFSSTQAGQLTNAGRPTVVSQWGCWNTYYVSPAYNTLAHKFLLSGDRGAAAVMGSTTLTWAPSEAAYGRLLMPYLARPGMTLGEAMLLAKNDLAASNPGMVDVLLGWTLLGDPTLTIVPESGE